MKPRDFDYESVGRRFESCRAHHGNQGVGQRCLAPFSLFFVSAPILFPLSSVKSHEEKRSAQPESQGISVTEQQKTRRGGFG